MADPYPASRGRPLRVAITGGAGSGKSLVCRRFRRLGAFVVDLDKLARDAVAPGSAGLRKVVDRFGKGVLHRNGRLDRRKLRQRIIADREARQDLEAIIHPEVLHRMQDQMDRAALNPVPLLMAEVPLLFEAGLERLFDKVVVVTAPKKDRIRRLSRRDGVSSDGAEALLRLQMSDAEKRRRADYVIENSGSMADTQEKVDRLFRELTGTIEKESKSA